MKLHKFILTVCLLTLTGSTLCAQGFLKKLTNKALDKVADKAADKIADDIATAAMRPISNMSEEFFKTKYKEENGKEWDDEEFENDEERTAAMQQLMGTMFKPVNLPADYSFDYSVEIEMKDNGKKQGERTVFLVSTSKNIFGVDQQGNKIVFDYDNDVMATYNEEEKSVFALSGIKSMTALGMKYAEQESMKEGKDAGLKIEKLSKTKKVAGYQCKGVKYKNDESEGEIYFSDNLPFNWEDTFMGAMAKMSPNFLEKQKAYGVSGFMMYAKSKDKENNKESKWEVKKIEKTNTIINNDSYDQVSMGGK